LPEKIQQPQAASPQTSAQLEEERAKSLKYIQKLVLTVVPKHSV